MSRSIGLLVSGQTEVVAAPVLVRRLMHERLHIFDVHLGRPVRKPEGQLLQQDKRILEDAIERLRRRHDAILVLIDLEDDCPARYGPILQARCDRACSNKPIAFVAAWRELETWFLWDAQRLMGTQHPGPERKRDAKTFLKRNCAHGYNEVADAPGLAAKLDLMHVRARSDSFRVFCDRVERLARALSA